MLIIDVYNLICSKKHMVAMMISALQARLFGKVELNLWHAALPILSRISIYVTYQTAFVIPPVVVLPLLVRLRLILYCQYLLVVTSISTTTYYYKEQVVCTGTIPLAGPRKWNVHSHRKETIPLYT